MKIDIAERKARCAREGREDREGPQSPECPECRSPARVEDISRLIIHGDDNVPDDPSSSGAVSFVEGLLNSMRYRPPACRALWTVLDRPPIHRVF